MGKKSDPPPPPDYRAAAEETAQGNLELLNQQTRANRPTQITPFGTVDWNEGADGNWTQTISLSPGEQSALDAQREVQLGRSNLASSMLGRVQGEYGDPISWDQFQEYAGPLSTGAEARQSAEDAIYSRLTSRLDPQFEERGDNLEATLRARGLFPGMEAYEREKDRLSRERVDAYDRAGTSAIIGGGQEATRQQGMDQTAANYLANLRQAQIGDEMRKRGFSLNEINAILTGQQVGLPQTPSFSQAGRTQGPDYMGAAQNRYGAEMDAYSADQARWNAITSGIFDVAAGFAGRPGGT